MQQFRDLETIMLGEWSQNGALSRCGKWKMSKIGKPLQTECGLFCSWKAGRTWELDVMIKE